MHLIVKVLTFIPRKIYGYADSLNTFLMSPKMIETGTSKIFVQTTKILGGTTGGIQVGKGLHDAHEAFLCADGLCFVVSCAGVAADSVQVIGSWLPGPNMTCVVTMPISFCCKTFVWCCKRGLLPRGNC